MSMISILNNIARQLPESQYKTDILNEIDSLANQTFSDLPAVTLQGSTDIYALSANGAGSYKETRAQMLSYTKANIATAPYVVGSLIYANGTNTLGKVADVATGNVLLSGGLNTVPAYGKVTYGHMQTAGASKLLGNPTGSTAAVSEITLGAGLSFVGTTLTATADSNVTSQEAYDNGTPGSKGTVVQTLDGLNPMAFFATNIGAPQIPLALVNFVNPNSHTLFPWRFDFRAPTAPSTNLASYAAIEINPENSSDSTTNGSLSLRVNSYTIDTEAFKISGKDQLAASFYPMQIQNGASVYQTMGYVTTDITYDGTQTGKVLLSDNTGIHLINIPASYFSTNADDSFTAQTQATYVMIAQVAGGATINGSTSPTTIPVNTRAKFQLVNPTTKAWMMTVETIPQGLPYATDFNGANVSVPGGGNISSASVTNSQSFRLDNYGMTTGKINFVATNVNCTLLILPPFGAAFTGTNQGSATVSIGNNGGNSGHIGVIDSISGQGIEINMELDATGTYDLTFSAGYSISN